MLIGMILSASAIYSRRRPLRRLRKVHWLLVLLVTGMLGALENGILAAGVMPKGMKDCLLTYVAFPILAFSSQILLLLALKFEKAGILSLVSCSDILFSIIFQYALWVVPPDIYTFCGGTIVVFALIINNEKWVEEMTPEDPRKKTLRVLLM